MIFRVSEDRFLWVVLWPCHGRKVMLVPLVPAVPAAKCPRFGGTHGWVLPMPNCAIELFVSLWSGCMSNDFCTGAPWLLEGYSITPCISSYSDHVLLCHRLPLAQAIIVLQDVVNTADTSVPTRNRCLPSWWAAQAFRTTVSSHKITAR